MPGEREIAQALLSSYEPSLRDRAGNAIYDIARALGMGSTANRMRNEGTAVMDFIPGVGEVLGVDDAMNDFNAGNYGMAAAGLGLTAVGAVPGVGDVASKALKNLPLAEYKHFATGVPVEFPYARNIGGLRKYEGAYGQDIEPFGRYMVDVTEGRVPEGWDSGKAFFKNPLVVQFGGDYGAEDNWKSVLSKQYGLAGKDLSNALSSQGFDGIVTVDKYGVQEIVDLSKGNN